MSGQFVVFRNPGVIDSRSIKTFGVSVKEGSNPIGYFGTGLKYAIAILLRMGNEVSIYAGSEVLKFSKKTTTIRGKDFEVITMNGEEMPFTTELGKNWEPWQAFREIYCNCIDEQGTVERTDLLPVTEEGCTIIVLRGEESIKGYIDRDTIVLKKVPDLLLKDGNIQVYDSPSHYLYYRGIRVLKLKNPAMLTYNITEYSELTEDRTLKNAGSISWRVSTAIAGLKNKKVIKAVLNASETNYEFWVDFQALDWNQELVSQEFQEVMAEEYEANSERLNATAKKWFIKKMDKEAYLNYQAEAMTNVEEMQLNKCVKILSAIYKDFPDHKILVVKSLGGTTMAVADMQKSMIVVSKDAFRFGTKFLLSTLIEEHFHLKTGYEDCTRHFQTYTFDAISTLIEEYILKEPV